MKPAISLRTTVINFLSTVVAVFISFNTSAFTYYVSNSGVNSNNGTSTSTPWETLAKVNAQTFLPGDSILFRAGDIWREVLTINESGTPGNFIYFGRYGTGANPKFVGSEKAENWTASGTTNVWQTSTALENYSDDYYAGRLFFIFDDTIAYGDYKPYVNLTELTEEFDYTANGTVHYVYSTIDPDLAYGAIEVNQRERVVNLSNFESYLEFNGLDILFGRRSGFWSGYPEIRGATDLVFRNCYIGYTGAMGSGSAYGLACFHSNTLIENCSFSDNGRRAISINTYTDNPGGRRIENIIIRNNTFKRGYHTTSLDLSTMNRTGDTVMNVYFYNNYIDDSEIKEIGSWSGSNQLFTQAGINTSLMTNIYIVGNVFVQSTARHILFENTITHYIWNNSIIGHNTNITLNPWGSVGLGGADTVDMRNNILYDNLPDNTLENNMIHGYNAGNVYFPNRDYNLYYSTYPGNIRNFTSIDVNGTHYYFNTNQWSNYRSAFPAYDINSPLPQNPNFTDYNKFDFTLSVSSIAKNTGAVLPYVIITDPSGAIDTINKYDIAGKLRSRSTPSIGAYEYQPPASINLKDMDKAFQIYPNPATDNVYIKTAIESTIRVIDLSGRLVYKQFNAKGITKINYKFQNGVYFVQIVNNKGASCTKKLIVK